LGEKKLGQKKQSEKTDTLGFMPKLLLTQDFRMHRWKKRKKYNQYQKS